MRLIDADALMDKYGDWYTEEGTEEGYIGTMKGIVDSMPTIEPERKQGRVLFRGIARTAVYEMDHPTGCRERSCRARAVRGTMECTETVPRRDIQVATG